MTPPTLDELRALMALADHPDQSPCDALRFDEASGAFVRAMLADKATKCGPPHALLAAVEEHRAAREAAEGKADGLASAVRQLSAEVSRLAKSNDATAAYVFDRAHQYVETSGIHDALIEVAFSLRRGEAGKAYACGELDDILEQWRATKVTP